MPTLISKGDRMNRMEIVNVFPKSIRKGEKFHLTPEGNCAIAVEAKHITFSTKIMFDGVELYTSSDGSSILTAPVPDELLVEPGEYLVQLADIIEGENVRSASHTFIVLGWPEIVDIFPKTVRKGDRFNINPEGKSTIVVEAKDLIFTTKIVFNGVELDTTFDGVSKLCAPVPEDLIAESGEYPVHLANELNGGLIYSESRIFRIFDWDVNKVPSHISSICDFNSLEINTEGEKHYVTISKREPLHIVGWILEDKKLEPYASIHIRLNGKLYEADRILTTHASDYFDNHDFSMARFESYILIPKLIVGDYELVIVGKTRAGEYYKGNFKIELRVRIMPADTPSPKQYRSCLAIEEQLFFDYGNRVNFCCTPPTDILPTIIRTNRFSVDYYLAVREKSKRYPLNACRVCDRYIERNTVQSALLGYIAVGGDNLCNFKCEFCTAQVDKHSSETVLRHLKELHRHNLLWKRATFVFASGEPALQKDIDELLAFVEMIGCRAEIDSNCSIYKKSFEKVLRKKGVIKCSLDAGTREIFFQVKGVDCFDRVIQNIEKYAAFGLVKVKYIIYELNYSESEILKFVGLMRKIGVKNIVFDFDNRDKQLDMDERYFSSMAMGKYIAERLGIFVELGTCQYFYPKLAAKLESYIQETEKRKWEMLAIQHSINLNVPFARLELRIKRLTAKVKRRLAKWIF